MRYVSLSSFVTNSVLRKQQIKLHSLPFIQSYRTWHHLYRITITMWFHDNIRFVNMNVPILTRIHSTCFLHHYVSDRSHQIRWGLNQSIYDGAAVTNNAYSFITRSTVQQCTPFSFGPFFYFFLLLCAPLLYIPTSHISIINNIASFILTGGTNRLDTFFPLVFFCICVLW